MPETHELSKLRWRCRRGTKELDTLTTRYLQQFYLQAGRDEQRAFVELLNLQDPQLHAILSALEISSDPHVRRIVEKIHSR